MPDPTPSADSLGPVVIIGAGIVGLATAYQWLRRYPASRVTVLEKESQPAQHQSSHNSGVLHAGLHYRPGSDKARLAVAGIRAMVAFCEEHSIPFDRCGKLVVASTETEVPRLAALHERGAANGLLGLARLSPAQMRELEPHVAGVAGLHVPEEGIVDYPAVCRTLVRLIQESGGRVITQAKATRIVRRGAEWTVVSRAGDFGARMLINCAGLHSDRVARLAGERFPLRIVPFRGDYYTLRPDRQHLVRNLIYPVPNPNFPFLGVHFTRIIGGGIEAGPNAMLAFSREGYRKTDLSVRDLGEALAFPGLWRFLIRYPRTSAVELLRSFSRARFAAALQRLVPEVTADDLVPRGAGVRAQAMLPNGQLVEDFHYVERPGALHLLNAPSPAATAALAIGDEVVTRAERH